MCNWRRKLFFPASIFLIFIASVKPATHSKELPLGITNIKEILDGGYVYVDKTHLIYEMLVPEYIYDYFMIRPKGFGKTLLLSTLEEILKGNQKLFEGTAISRTNYNWLKYPVLRFDFSNLKNEDTREFEDSLKKVLEIMAKTNGVEPAFGRDFEFQLRRLIEDVSKKCGTRVALLVDEYDSPLIASLNRGGENTERWRNTLLSFLNVVTELSDEFIQFSFVTGVNQFSVCGPKGCSRDHLIDITLNTKYAALLGFTRDELETYFGGYLGEKGLDSPIWDEMETLHNGYRFSEGNISLYSPHSTLNYLMSFKRNETFSHTDEQIPPFLIERVRENPRSLFKLINPAREGFPLGISNNKTLKKMDLEPFLLQTGHLTIRGYDDRDNVNLYELDFRNEQARINFFHSFLKGLTELDPLKVCQKSEQMKQKLETLDMSGFISEIIIHVSRIPMQLRQYADFYYYQVVFYLLMENFGLQTQIEHEYDRLRVELPQVVALFQFTLNKTAETALEHLIKFYKENMPQNKQTFCVGIDFSLESCNIHDWKGVLYDGEDVIRRYPFVHDQHLKDFLKNMTARDDHEKKKS